MESTERHVVLSTLREAIRKLERRPARRAGAVPCGRAEIDEALPAGGFQRGALTELVGGPASGKTAAVLALFAALGPEDLYAWVDARGELYPPAAAALGVDLARLLVVRPALAAASAPTEGSDRTMQTALWAAEALLASGAFAAVAVDVPPARLARGADAAARRLQAAAEKGGAIGLWLAGPGATMRVPAAARLELGARGIGAATSRSVDARRRAGRGGHAA
jgi:protein ImuA